MAHANRLEFLAGAAGLVAGGLMAQAGGTHAGKKPFETVTLDARKVGLQAAVIEDACRGIDTGGSLGKAWAQMQKAGVKRMQSADLGTA